MRQSKKDLKSEDHIKSFLNKKLLNKLQISIEMYEP